MTRSRTLAAALFLLLAALPLVPAASASDTITTCSGGHTDTSMRTLDGTTYVSTSDLTVWKDTNGKKGIQREPVTCTVTDPHYKVLYSYVETPADDQYDAGDEPPAPPKCVLVLYKSYCVL